MPIESFSHRGFRGTLDFSVIDNVYFGRVLDVKELITYESPSIEGLYEEFKVTVDDYIAMSLILLDLHRCEVSDK